jgi:hypothetical protein
MPEAAPIAVVETPEFLSATRKLMTEEERAPLVDHLAHNPTTGDLVQEPAACASCGGDWRGVESVAGHAWFISATAPNFRCSRLRLTPRTSERI